MKSREITMDGEACDYVVALVTKDGNLFRDPSERFPSIVIAVVDRILSF